MTLQDKQKEILEKFDELFGKDQYGGIQAFRQDLVKPFVLHSLSEIAEATKEAITAVGDKRLVGGDTGIDLEAYGWNKAIDEMNKRYEEFIKETK